MAPSRQKSDPGTHKVVVSVEGSKQCESFSSCPDLVLNPDDDGHKVTRPILLCSPDAPFLQPDCEFSFLSLCERCKRLPLRFRVHPRLVRVGEHQRLERIVVGERKGVEGCGGGDVLNPALTKVQVQHSKLVRRWDQSQVCDGRNQAGGERDLERSLLVGESEPSVASLLGRAHPESERRAARERVCVCGGEGREGRVRLITSELAQSISGLL